MPSSWTAKRERQYEHIKESERKSGKSSRRAKQIAAATVNKQRRQAHETTGKTPKLKKGHSTSRQAKSTSSRAAKRRPRGKASSRRRKETR